MIQISNRGWDGTRRRARGTVNLGTVETFHHLSKMVKTGGYQLSVLGSRRAYAVPLTYSFEPHPLPRRVAGRRLGQGASRRWHFLELGY